MNIDCVLTNPLLVEHVAPVFTVLARRGARARFVCSAPGRFVQKRGAKLDLYQRCVTALQAAGLPYGSEIDPNADVALSALGANELHLYRGIKLKLRYGVSLHRAAIHHNFAMTHGFDGILAHGDFERDLFSRWIARERIARVGMPRHAAYLAQPLSKAEARARLGIDETVRPVIVYFPTWSAQSSLTRFAESLSALAVAHGILVKPHALSYASPHERAALARLARAGLRVLDEGAPRRAETEESVGAGSRRPANGSLDERALPPSKAESGKQSRLTAAPREHGTSSPLTAAAQEHGPSPPLAAAAQHRGDLPPLTAAAREHGALQPPTTAAQEHGTSPPLTAAARGYCSFALLTAAADLVIADATSGAATEAALLAPDTPLVLLSAGAPEELFREVEQLGPLVSEARALLAQVERQLHADDYRHARQKLCARLFYHEKTGPGAAELAADAILDLARLPKISSTPTRFERAWPRIARVVRGRAISLGTKWAPLPPRDISTSR